MTKRGATKPAAENVVEHAATSVARKRTHGGTEHEQARDENGQGATGRTGASGVEARADVPDAIAHGGAPEDADAPAAAGGCHAAGGGATPATLAPSTTLETPTAAAGSENKSAKSPFPIRGTCCFFLFLARNHLTRRSRCITSGVLNRFNRLLSRLDSFLKKSG